MKRAAFGLLALITFALLAWTIAGEREAGVSSVSCRETRFSRESLSGFRPPVEIDPITLGVRMDIASPSFARQMDSLQQTGDLDGVNLLLPTWFQTDPEAVRNWLIEQDDLTAFQPALAAIACYLSTSGNSTLAVQWASLLEDPSLREKTLCSILALGFRQGDFNEKTLLATGISREKVEAILSGAEGD